MSQHAIARPGWTCETCHDDWPCESARKLIADAHIDDHDALVEHLTGILIRAADDLGLASPALLYKRFLRWALPTGQVCRVCERPGHDAAPGVPPRLVPCDGRVVEPLRESRKAP